MWKLHTHVCGFVIPYQSMKSLDTQKQGGSDWTNNNQVEERLEDKS